MKPEILEGKIEIEHKFLVKQPIDIPIPNVKYLIIQNYLPSNKGTSERIRVSIDSISLSKVFTYTKKIPQTIGQMEFETEISEESYQKLLKTRDINYRTIIKTRTVFDYKGLKFELDNFAEPINFSMLEIEVDKLKKNIEFPEFIDVLFEVTKESGFSNGSIAKDPLTTKKKIKKLKDGF